MEKALAEANKEVAMRLFLILTALLLTASKAAFAAPQTWTVNLPLTNIRPSEFLTLVANSWSREAASARSTSVLPPGVESIVPNDPERRLNVRGTTAGLARMRELIRLMDVRPNTVRLNVRLVRLLPSGKEATRLDIVSSARTSVANDTTVPMAFHTASGDYLAVLKPRVHSDKSVTLAVELRSWEWSDATGAATTGTRRLQPGRWERLAGVVPSRVRKVTEGAETGGIVYLEAQVTPAAIRPQVGVRQTRRN